MTKMDAVRQEMMQAMKAKDKPRKDALSLLLAALKNKAIDKRADLTPEEENAIILREIKQCQETLDTTPADRVELRAEAETRMKVYQEFAPRMMEAAEITALIDQVLAQLGLAAPTPKEKGLIMKHLMPLVKGKADGALVNRLLADRLK